MHILIKRKWWFQTLIGLFLMFSPFMGFPTTIKEAIYVVLGTIILWLSVIKSEDNI